MTLTPLAQNDPRLRQVCAALSLKQLRTKEQQLEIDALIDYVMGRGNKTVPGTKRDQGKQSVVGLSANQVGIMKQICVVDLSIGRKGYHDLHVLINPRIVWMSKASVYHNEGCVNFATVRGDTDRAKTVKVEAIDRSGNEISLKLTGWPAVLLQHEVGHINGQLFIDVLPNPDKADLVEAGEYKNYRKHKADWPYKIDVSAQVVTK